MQSRDWFNIIFHKTAKNFQKTRRTHLKKTVFTKFYKLFSPEGQQSIHEEDGSIDDGHGGLGELLVLGVALEGVLPALDDQATAGHEEGTAGQREEDVDATVDRSLQKVT